MPARLRGRLYVASLHALFRRLFSACLSCLCPIHRGAWQLGPAASCIRARRTCKSTETECSSINELVAPHLLPPRPPAHVALEWHYSRVGPQLLLPLSRRCSRWQQHCANSTNKTWLSALLPDCEKACRSVRLGFRPANGCRLFTPCDAVYSSMADGSNVSEVNNSIFPGIH